MIEQLKPYNAEFNCLTTDLINNVPPSTAYEIGSKMYVFDGTTKALLTIFILSGISGTKAWYEL